MFILGDDTHDRGKLPWVTFTLMALNFLVYCAQHRFGERMTNGYGLVPKEITEFRDITTKQPITVHGPRDVFVDEDGEVHVHGNGRIFYIHHYPGPVPIVLTFFSYMFLHGGFFHLVFNLYALFMIGPGLERIIGSVRFAFYYLLSGLGSSAEGFGLRT